MPLQIGLRAFLNGGGDFLHFGITGICAEHLATGNEAVEYGYQAKDNCERDEIHEFAPPYILIGTPRTRGWAGR